MSKNIKGLITYLEAVMEQSGEDMEVLVDGCTIDDFENYIDVDHVRDYVDFITPSYTSM